jgi:hypothetical protein|nr:MAG TPA: tail completion protein [Caudoviricetes sp.]
MTSSTAALIAYLKRKFPGVKVSNRVPMDRPSRFVTVERTGGNRTHLWDSPVFAVQAWAQTEVEASALADEVADAILDWQLDPIVAYSAVNAVYAFPDPDARVPRFQLTVSATLALA